MEPQNQQAPPAEPATQSLAEQMMEELGDDVGGVGDLLIAPTRVVLAERDRFAEFTLVNIGDSESTYRISFTELRMTPEGQLETVELEDATNPASEFIRYSPRQVTLEPGVAQTVRLQVLRPADLEPGEYRSHLLFHGVPPVDRPPAPEGEQEGLSISLIPIYGISIPVIVRQEPTSADAELTDPVLSTEGDALTVVLHRTGNRSIYGDLEVRFFPAGQAEGIVVGEISGVAVYTPLDRRLVPISLAEGAVSGTGRLVVTFRNAEPGSERRVLARLETQISGDAG